MGNNDLGRHDKDISPVKTSNQPGVQIITLGNATVREANKDRDRTYPSLGGYLQQSCQIKVCVLWL